MKQRSEIWSHFERQGNARSAADKAKCRYCDYVASAQPKRLLKHFLMCSNASQETQNRVTCQNLVDSSVTRNTSLQTKEVSRKPSKHFVVEKVLKLQTRSGTKEALVKWRGWPSKYNSWIAQRELPNYAKKRKLL